MTTLTYLIMDNFCAIPQVKLMWLKILKMACSKKSHPIKKETIFFCSFYISVAR